MANARRATSNHRQSASRSHAQVADKPSLWVRIQRWFLQLAVTIGMVAVIAGAVQGGLYLLDLQVERIAITGTASNVSVDEIQSLVAPQLHAGFLSADLDGIREQLEAMPWVYRANVRRRWPDAVVIQIEEQRPIARWGLDGFLNHEGEYFAGGMSERWQGLARLEGPEGSEAKLMRRYLSLEALLTDTGMQVIWLGEDDIGQVSVELDNGTLLILGNDHFVKRVRRFISLYAQQLQDRQVVRVDLRYEHGAAVELLENQFAMNDAHSQSSQSSLNSTNSLLTPRPEDAQ